MYYCRSIQCYSHQLIRSWLSVWPWSCLWLASTLSASRPAIELPRVRTRSAKALRRSRQVEGRILLLFLRSAPTVKRNFLLLPWLVAPRKHSILYVVWTTMARLTIFHLTGNRRLPQALLRDELCRQDFAGPISFRAFRVLGPISRYRVADILLHMKLASRASRPGLTVGLLRILCSGLCTAQRFHTEGEGQTFRFGCPNEPDSLPHYNECLLLYNRFTSIW